MERFNYRSMSVTREETIPFLIMGDARTVMIATTLLRQVTQKAYGFSGVSALKPAVSKSGLYGDIVMWTNSTGARTDELDRFYRNEWLHFPVLPRKSSMPVRWSISANNALADLSRNFRTKRQPAGNKSLAFCVIMAFAAKYRYGLSIPD